MPSHLLKRQLQKNGLVISNNIGQNLTIAKINERILLSEPAGARGGQHDAI